MVAATLGLSKDINLVPDFLQGGGEMGALIRAYDWAASPLGTPATWPVALKVAVRLLLSTQHPIFLWWGPELIQFYNDAYRRSIGPERHPHALGQRGHDCWVEIWPIIGSQIDQVMSGRGSTWNENHLVPITRHGKREDVYWTYSFSPIDDANAPHGIGGVLVMCTETTETILAEQRLRKAQERTQFRMQVADALHSMSDPAAIMNYVTEALGYHLRVDQANYYVRAGDEFVVEGEWRTPGTKSLRGRHSLIEFGANVGMAKSGSVLRIDDTSGGAPGFKELEMAGSFLFRYFTTVSGPQVCISTKKHRAHGPMTKSLWCATSPSVRGPRSSARAPRFSAKPGKSVSGLSQNARR